MKGSQLLEETAHILTEEKSSLSINSTSEQPSLIDSLYPSNSTSSAVQLITPQSYIPEDLLEYPRSATHVELCSDANLRLSLIYVYKPNELIILFVLTNQSTYSISDLTLTIQPPSNLKPDSNENLSCTVETLDSRASQTHIIAVTLRSPALHMVLSGHVIYSDSTNTQKRLFISHVMSMRDLLRSVVMDTQTFGGQWTQRSLYEKKHRLAGKFNVQTWGDLLQQWNFHIVDTIGKHFGSYRIPTIMMILKVQKDLVNESILSVLF